MTEHTTVRVHFIDDSERIVPAKNIHNVGEEGARSTTAIVDGREVPIYNRVEWGLTWYEQEAALKKPIFDHCHKEVDAVYDLTPAAAPRRHYLRL